MTTKPVTAPAVRAMKGDRPIVMLTAYDYPSARLVDRSGADIILVGDSLGMVVLGQPDTLSVSLDIMLHHTRAVTRGVERALVVGDMPWMTYHTSTDAAVENAARFIHAGARAVKVEGGKDSRLRMIRAILDAEIPVMGHVGLTPQSVMAIGGFRVQGKGEDDARRLIDEARALEEAGCFSLVLECVPTEVAEIITSTVSIPTIGIGAGSSCDGQVLVFHDLLGLYEGHQAKFVRRYAEIGDAIEAALETFASDVRERRFPDDANESFHVSSDAGVGALYAGRKG